MRWAGTLDYWRRGQLFAPDKMVVRVANNKYVVALFPLKMLKEGELARVVFDIVFYEHFNSLKLIAIRRRLDKMLKKHKAGA